MRGAAPEAPEQRKGSSGATAPGGFKVGIPGKPAKRVLRRVERGRQPRPSVKPRCAGGLERTRGPPHQETGPGKPRAAEECK